MRGHCHYMEYLDQYVDQGLSVRMTNEVAAHVKECSSCADLEAQIRQVTQATARLDAPPQPVGIKARVMAQVRAEQRAGFESASVKDWSHYRRIWRYLEHKLGLFKRWLTGHQPLIVRVGTASMVVIALLGLVLLRPTPAAAIGRTLERLKNINSAHFEGWIYTYLSVHGSQTAEGGTRIDLEGWYSSPDRAAWELRSEGQLAQRWWSDGSKWRGQLYSEEDEAPSIVEQTSGEAFFMFFDLFEQNGHLTNALRKGGDLVDEWEESRDGKQFRVFDVRFDHKGLLEKWWLYTDKESNLLVATKQEVYDKLSGALLIRTMVEHINFDVPIPPHIFEL